MATPVLPYPNMDFTPLDILTAAEMDQMVANDQYLRDFCAGLADGTNLSDGVIQARKIDFTTIPIPYVDYSTELLVNSIPFTAPRDLFVLAAIEGTEGAGGCVLYVNGKRVGQNNNTKAITVGFFVRTGDVITKSVNSTVPYCYVYDVKWV